MDSAELDIFAGLDFEPAPKEEKKFLPTTVGRADAAPYSLQKLAKEHTEEALDVVLNIMRFAEDDSTKLEAAKQILDRGWGKASIKVQTERLNYTLSDLESSLFAGREEVDVKVLEARRKESEGLGRYIVDDVEVVEDPAVSS